jgi:hypothetical protein
VIIPLNKSCLVIFVCFSLLLRCSITLFVAISFNVLIRLWCIDHRSFKIFHSGKNEKISSDTFSKLVIIK